MRTLRPGTVWWRIHGDGHGPTAFRDAGAESKRADPSTFGTEGRFDCQASEYGYLYLGETKGSTIAEAYLRGPAVSDPTARFLRRARLAGRVLSRIRIVTELSVVDLCGAAGLGRVGQDAWLTACDEEDCPLTQRWATAMRRWAPDACGMVWMSKRDNLHEAAILFSDRVPPDALTGEVARRLDTPLGITLVEKVLARSNVALGAQGR